MSKPNRQEQVFLDAIADKSKTYIYHPYRFYFEDGTNYMPDFYCKEDNSYIEVSGTRQAYQNNKHKYLKMNHELPHVNFQVVRLDKSEKKVYTSPKYLLFNSDTSRYLTMIKKLLIPLKHSLNITSLNSLANLIGIKQSTLYRLLHKQSIGSIRIWEKIEKYYNLEGLNENR